MPRVEQMNYYKNEEDRKLKRISQIPVTLYCCPHCDSELEQESIYGSQIHIMCCMCDYGYMLTIEDGKIINEDDPN